jgi:Ran GTPase-activating protein (RanGAP) involved in mRNA processing and transport
VDGYDALDEVAVVLAESPRWAGLRALDLFATTVNAEAAEVLFGAKHLHALRRLSLTPDGWTKGTWRALAAARFTQLTDLRLCEGELSDADAEALAELPHLASLRYLDLGFNNIAGRGLTALVCSPHLAGVAFLGLESNPLARVGAKKLAAAAPGGLRLFHCHGSTLRTADVRALARCPRLRTLWYLDLDENGLGTDAVKELVRGFGEWCPPVVWLTENKIDNTGAKMIADWKAAKALRVLQLYDNPLTDAGVRALLDSPNLTGLNGLGVSGASAATEKRIKKRFKKHGTVH